MGRGKGYIQKIVKILIISAFILYSFFVAKDVRRYFLLRREVREIEKKCRLLKEKNMILEEELKRLKDDKNYIEKVIRKELGWVRNDEKIYILK